MNWLDILLLCLAGIGFVKGLFDGVIKQVVLLIALWVGIFCSARVAVWLHSAFTWFPAAGVFTSYILAFVLTVGVIWLVGMLVDQLIGVTPLGVINHLLGGLFGAGLMLIVASFFLNVTTLIDRKEWIITEKSKTESHLYAPVKQIVPTIYPSHLFTENK